MNLRSEINRLEEMAKNITRGKKIIIVGYSEAELKEKREEYSIKNSGPVEFVNIRIVYDDPLLEEVKESENEPEEKNPIS